MDHPRRGDPESGPPCSGTQSSWPRCSASGGAQARAAAPPSTSARARAAPGRRREAGPRARSGPAPPHREPAAMRRRPRPSPRRGCPSTHPPGQLRPPKSAAKARVKVRLPKARARSACLPPRRPRRDTRCRACPGSSRGRGRRAFPTYPRARPIPAACT